MSEVRIKKSVLQSIIRKHLNESSGKRPDPSRRLTIGPDSLTIPDELPLSPSDRMSTQLEIERPPVEDPEYIPANSKELGHAVQALAELVDDENVESVYNSFKEIIESLNSDESEEEGEEDEEDQESEELQESLNRKYKLLMSLLRESEETPEEADIDLARPKIVKTPEQAAIDLARLKRAKDKRMEREDAEEETGLSVVGSADLDATNRARALRAYPETKDEYLALKLDKIFDADMVPFETQRRFMSALGEDEILRNQAKKASRSDLRDLIKTVNRDVEGRKEGEKKSRGVVSRMSRGLAVGDEGPKDSGEGSQWAKIAPIYGYKTTSGIRQATDRDLLAHRGLMFYLDKEDDVKEAHGLIKTAYKEAMGDEEGITKEQFNYLYRQFKGIVFKKAFDEVNEKIMGTQPSSKRRSIKDAMMATVFPGDKVYSKGNPPLTDDEKAWLGEWAKTNPLYKAVDRLLRQHQANNYSKLIDLAGKRNQEDLKAAKAGKFSEPSLTSSSFDIDDEEEEG